MFCPSVKDKVGEGNVNPLQYSCLGNLMDREAQWAPVQRVAKESDTVYRLNKTRTRFLPLSLFVPTKEMIIFLGMTFIGGEKKVLVKVLFSYKECPLISVQKL